MTSVSGGLGRGLAAILTGPVAGERDDSLRSRFVESALSSLSNGRALELCGYIHHHNDADATVTLRSPELRSLHPTQGYQLFASLSSVAANPAGRHRFMFGKLECWAVTQDSGDTRGLLFFGDAGLDETAMERLANFCHVYMPVILEHDRPATEEERLHLVLDQAGGTVHAEVSVGDAVGFGSAARTDLAAAQAALSARCADAKLVDVGSVRTGDGAASFVVAAGDMGRIGMGAAPVAEGPDAAAAVAALRASHALNCSPPPVPAQR
ncbi:MAG: hypothetical protein ACC660_06930 [Acidimicrobiales bacterium]